MQLTKAGKVIALFISDDDNIMEQKTSLFTDQKGIIGDKHYNKKIERTVLITSLESYALAEAHQIIMPYGSLGENLLIDYNPYALPVDSKLKIGEAVLQITQNCTLCSHLSKIDKRVPKLLKNDRGVFAKVVEKGEIREGDSVYLPG